MSRDTTNPIFFKQLLTIGRFWGKGGNKKRRSEYIHPLFTAWSFCQPGQVCFGCSGEIYRLDGLLIFGRIQKVWKYEGRQDPPADLDKFRGGNFRGIREVEPREKFLRPIFRWEQKGAYRGELRTYVHPTSMKSICRCMQAGQLPLCRWRDKGLFSIGRQWFRSFARRARVFYENL